MCYRKNKAIKTSYPFAVMFFKNGYSTLASLIFFFHKKAMTDAVDFV
jgi:hypothetical protein